MPPFLGIFTGKVAFDFAIDLSQLTRQGIVQASPSEGKVAAGEKVHVKLKVRRGAEGTNSAARRSRHCFALHTVLRQETCQHSQRCLLPLAKAITTGVVQQ